MKIFTAADLRAWDKFTIETERIKSSELMNRAAQAFVRWFTDLFPTTNRPVFIVCGTGNNGGDGLAVARFLHLKNYGVRVFVGNFSKKYSPDFDTQLKNLPPRSSLPVTWMEASAALPKIPADAIIIDALFGSGLNRPLEGNWQILALHLNELPNEIVAMDVPSGLFIDRHSSGTVVRATRTFSFETPKLAFFFPENHEKTGEWTFSSIGLHREFSKITASPFHFIDREMARSLVRKRSRFSHKGTFGHALLLAGSLGKMGAAVLAAQGCLRSGVGLLTVHSGKSGGQIVQIAVPEAMFSPDEHENWLSKIPNPDRFEAVGIGPGIGTEVEVLKVLEGLFKKPKTPLVLDADALNLLAAMPRLLKLVPKNAVLTPHPKEFERLFGRSENDFARLELLRSKCRELQIFIILKGAWTAVGCPDGSVFFNSTGNPGMATGGSGDVLTGVLTGLLAQGIGQRDACLLGVFLHGLAGDLAAAAKSQQAMTAGDLVAFLGNAWLEIEG